jgi:hypothetical protein
VKNTIIRKTNVDDIEESVKLANAVYRLTYSHMMREEIFDFNQSTINEQI